MYLSIVYLSSKVPRYVFDNLEYLKKSFPKQELVFISDNNEALKKASKIGVTAWLYCPEQHQEEQLRAASNLPMHFRDGFWFTTSSRFLALDAFLQAHKGSSILQIEADVWLASNFPFEKFEEMDCEIAFPLETARTGAASVLFLSDETASSKFAQIVRNRLISNPNSTDMLILGEIHNSNMMETIILPSAPRHSRNITAKNEQTDCEYISQEVERFKGLFDAVTYGLFLCGEDSRNHRGIRYSYQDQPNHLVRPSEFLFEMKESTILVKSQETLPLYNLHVHSKARAAWKLDGNQYLNRRIKNSTKGPTREWIPFVTFIMALKSLKRRLRAIG